MPAGVELYGEAEVGEEGLGDEEVSSLSDSMRWTAFSWRDLRLAVDELDKELMLISWLVD